MGNFFEWVQNYVFISFWAPNFNLYQFGYFTLICFQREGTEKIPVRRGWRVRWNLDVDIIFPRQMNVWPCQLDDLATWHTTLPHGMPGQHPFLMRLLPSREALHPFSSLCVTLTTAQPPPPVVDVTSSCLHLHIVYRKGHAIAGESRETVGGLR